MDNHIHSVAGRDLSSCGPAVKAALMLTGFSAVIGQIVLMRELMVVFSGNEISLGIMLATWLFWTAAGSILCGSLAVRENRVRQMVAVLECLLGLSLPLTVWALRASKSLFQAVPGELVGPVPVLLASLVCLSVFCAVGGALFVAVARMYSHECSVSARAAVSAAYLLEAAGSGLGGIVASFVLLRSLEPFQIACVVLVLNILMAIILLLPMSRRQICISMAVGALLAILLLVYVAPWLESAARANQWRGLHLLASRDSIYGNLTVVETGNVRSLYENGVILANSPNESAAEEAVHYALLEHKEPRRILMIGGGASGVLAQALRHPTVERIDLVELDPALISMARQYFQAESSAFISDPRVHLHYADGRYYLKSASGAFDVIIVNVPDPQTAQLNRFYTAEFFRSARDHLAPGGLLALELPSSEEAISPGLADFLRCINRTLQEVFPYVVALPGETIHFFAATRSDVLTDDPRTLVARLLERNLRTRYVREYFIPYRMMPDRMMQVREQLQPLATTQVNRDFSPIAYYFNVVLWSAQFKPAYAGWLRAAGHVNFNLILGVTLVVLFAIALLLAFVPPARRDPAAAGCCMAATGFTLMALEIILLLAFQSIYGYVYHHGGHCNWKLAGDAPHSPCQQFSLPRRCNYAVSSRLVCSNADAARQLVRAAFRKANKLAGGAMCLSCVGRAVRDVRWLPVPLGDRDLSSRRQQPAKARHTLCHRLTRRLSGRIAAERLSYSCFRILEDCMVHRGGEPGAGTSGRAGWLGREENGEIAEARVWRSFRFAGDTPGMPFQQTSRIETS
jgi:spermidine synthase